MVGTALDTTQIRVLVILTVVLALLLYALLPLEMVTVLLMTVVT